MRVVKNDYSAIPFRVALLCATALLGVMSPAPSFAQQSGAIPSGHIVGSIGQKAFRYEIPAGEIGQALTSWAATSRLRLVASSDALRNIRTEGLSGLYRPEEALERLLQNTDLRVNFTGKRTVTIVNPSLLNAHAQASLSPIEVSDQKSKDVPAVQGFVPQRSAGATKTNTSILETPQSVSVVGRQQVVNQGSQSIVDALRFTSGVSTNINPNDNRFESLRIRGFEPVLYLDGLQLPYGSQLFGRPKVDPFMLDRIEVLKGPSSALFGQIAPGGLVNMVSLLPTTTPIRMVEFQANSLGRLQAGFDVGGPADPKGNLLYRITGVIHDGGTQIDHVDDFRGAISPSFTWRPDMDTTLTVLGSYQRDDGGVAIQFLPSVGTLYPNPNGQLPISKFVGEPGFNKFTRTQYWAGYQFEHHASDVWTLRQNLRYASIDTTVKAVMGAGLQADKQTLNRWSFIVPEKADAFTVDNQAEARFNTGALSHIALFGLDYRHVTSEYSQYFGLGAPPLNLYRPVYGAAIAPPPLTTHTGQVQDQIGLYVQDQIAFDRWRLTLSGRHDWVSTDTTNYLSNTRQNQSDSKFSGRAGLNYLFDSGVAPYIAYARSFQPLIGTLGGTSQPLKPTTGEQYEAGVKYQPVGTNILLTAAVFDITQQNIVTTYPLPIGQQQTGEGRSRGIELEASASLTNGLNLVAAYTYTDTKNTSTGNAAQLDKHFITVPLHQAAVWADYTIQEGRAAGFGFGGGVRYVGESFGDAANTILIPDYTLFDAVVHYDLSNLDPRLRGTKVAVNVYNIFDKAYVSTCASLNQCYYGTGRVVTGSLRYTW